MGNHIVGGYLALWSGDRAIGFGSSRECKPDVHGSALRSPGTRTAPKTLDGVSALLINIFSLEQVEKTEFQYLNS